ncbi:MAG: hypothetical protein AAF443_05870 [Chlamydiota bacterium]
MSFFPVIPAFSVFSQYLDLNENKELREKEACHARSLADSEGNVKKSWAWSFFSYFIKNEGDTLIIKPKKIMTYQQACRALGISDKDGESLEKVNKVYREVSEHLKEQQKSCSFPVMKREWQSMINMEEEAYNLLLCHYKNN